MQGKKRSNTEQWREVELSVAELFTALSKSLRSAVSAIQGTESFCFLVSKKFTIHTFYNQLISISTHYASLYVVLRLHSAYSLHWIGAEQHWERDINSLCCGEFVALQSTSDLAILNRVFRVSSDFSS